MATVDEDRDDWRHFQLPRLELPEMSPWKKAMYFTDWMKRVCVSTNSVSLRFSDYVKSMFLAAEARYKTQQGTATAVRLRHPAPEDEEYDRKFALLLLSALPERVTTNCMRLTEGVDSVPCGNVLDVVFMYVSPGGVTEASALVQYARNPGVAKSGREAKDMLNEWLIARKRLAVVSMPDLAPMEQVNAMVGIVSEVLKTDSVLQHRFDGMRYSTSARSPSQEDATRIEQFLVAELNFIESNEMVEEGMKDNAWHLQEVPGRINAVLQGGLGFPKPSPKGEPKKVCTKFLKGKCTYGSGCF